MEEEMWLLRGAVSGLEQFGVECNIQEYKYFVSSWLYIYIYGIIYNIHPFSDVMSS